MQGEQAALAAIKPTGLLAGAAIAIFLAVFAGWGMIAPLEGGAMAAGRISPEGNRQTVQHFEGGIIEEILVSNGDVVAAGQGLFILRSVQARTSYEILLNRAYQLEAQLDRLLSKQSSSSELVFGEALLDEAQRNPEVAQVLANQREIFARRTELDTNRVAVLERRTAQLRAEIDGLEEQIVSQDRRLELIAEEIQSTQHLLDRGLAPRPRLLALQREQAAISEAKAGNRAAIARALQAIGESEVQSLALEAERLSDLSAELDEVYARLSEVRDRLTASEDVLSRTRIVSPVAGTVVNMQMNTAGAVVAPGGALLDIVPAEERLVIEARLSPIHVDSVVVGQAATIHLSALPQNQLPRMYGHVISISADALQDEATGEAYFAIKVEVTDESLAALEAAAVSSGEQLFLVPGMPAEVLVVTGERTMIDYLVEPLVDTLRGAMREG